MGSGYISRLNKKMYPSPTICHKDGSLSEGKWKQPWKNLAAVRRPDFSMVAEEFNPASGRSLPGDMALSLDCARSGYSALPSGAAICGCRHWRSQFCRRQAFVQDLMNSILGLQHGSRGWIIRLFAFSRLLFVIRRCVRRRNVEDARKCVLHLGNGIVLQDDNQLTILLRLLQRSGWRR